MSSTMPEKPAHLPAEAGWDAGDREWVLAPTDADGRNHGLVTYWRPDGSVVNHCPFVHGTPHGVSRRYHESGEVSRECTFVDGALHGVDRCYRSTAPTTELAFPAGTVPASVHRYELDRVHGTVVSARFYDRHDQQVTDTGEPLPPRPQGVPETAVYLSRSAVWLVGETDTEDLPHGFWQSYNQEGVLVGEREMEHGTEVFARSFACQEDADATIALRDGRSADALAAARRWWARAEQGSSEDRILAGELLARCLDGGGGDGTEAQRRRLYTMVAEEPGVAWVFTDSGRRCGLAQAAALDWLARDALQAGDAERAIELGNRSISVGKQYGFGVARATKATALRHLGRHDEAYALAREILADDPDAAGLDDVREDPAFAAWLESKRADTMTLAGAWETVGRRGERLAALAALLPPRAETDDGHDEDARRLDARWPIRDVLGDQLSPELDRWLDIARAVARTYDGDLQAAVSSSIGAAVAAEDGTWRARLEGLFLPVSVVLIGVEEIWHATWLAGPDGNSQAYYTHQDEPGFWGRASLSATLASTVLRQVEYRDLDVPAAVRERLARAHDLIDGVAPAQTEPHLSVEALYPRTGWIVEHLLGIGAEHDLAHAPGIDVWQSERELAVTWPHLQAYWLLHHLVFDNREELSFLLEHAERRHHAVAELAAIAEQAIAGEQVSADWWDATAVNGLRTTAVDNGHSRLLTEAALARITAGLRQRDGSAVRLAAAKADLAGTGDRAVDELMELWAVLERVAGSIEQFERSSLQAAYPDTDEQMGYFSSQNIGHTSILLRMLAQIPALVTSAQSTMAEIHALFDAAVRQGAEYADDHATVVPGALVGLGAATHDFAGFLGTVEQLITSQRLGRRRRAELAIVAAHRYDQSAAREFLVEQAQRYAQQLHDAKWSVDTMSYALSQLLELGPAVGGPVLSDALAGAHLSGANWRAAIALCERAGQLEVNSAAPGLLAALDAGLGRHDDGQRATVVRAYVACAGAASAVPELERRLATITDVRIDCERCALLAGLLIAAPESSRWRDDARAVLETLLAGHVGSMEAGAAISMLQSVDRVGAAGFGQLAERVHIRAKDEKYVKAGLVTWLAAALPRLRAER